MAAALDYSKPLATLMRESTHSAHERAERSEGAKLLGGHLPKTEYVRYLMMLWHVYDTFEKALDRHASHKTLEPTYNPALLARAPSLASDIAYLLQVDEVNWASHPLHQRLLANTPAPLLDYIDRLTELADSPDPSALLAHSYVRYLGDLSGGQTVRHTIAKAYELDEASGLGVSFYNFKELRSAKNASQGEMKRIKEWFRAGMNTAGERNEVDVKASIVAEASKAFDLNTGLLSAIGLESDDTKDELDSVAASSRPIPLSEQAFPFSSVIAVVAAAHFILVTGGFTGSSGYQKLLAFERWLRNIWQSSTD